MKKCFFLIAVLLTSVEVSFAQQKTWFDKITIGQSMETAEQTKEPAQFQLTLPKKDSASWLTNIGLSYKLGSNSHSLLSKLTTEYHRNTVIDKKQNNLMLGYSYTWQFDKKVNNKNVWFSVGDLKYVYDGIEIKNSFAANILLTFSNDDSRFLHWNANKYYGGVKRSIFLSLFGGLQIQDVFNAKSDSAKGLILRPTFTSSLIYDFNDIKDTSTNVRLSISYTGRKDAINNTKNLDEGYTQLLKAGLEVFLLKKPLKISIGASFNYGSDPLKGLKDQQFWLLSFNFQKGKK